MSMLPVSLMKEPIAIQSYPNEADEIMHGIGLRLSSHLEHGGETSSKGTCSISAELAAKEKASFKADKVSVISCKEYIT